jgi:hypothetical protein
MQAQCVLGESDGFGLCGCVSTFDDQQRQGSQRSRERSTKLDRCWAGEREAIDVVAELSWKTKEACVIIPGAGASWQRVEVIDDLGWYRLLGVVLFEQPFVMLCCPWC